MSKNEFEIYYTLDEVMEIMNFGRRTILNHIKTKKLSAVRIGYNYKVSRAQLREYQDTIIKKK